SRPSSGAPVRNFAATRFPPSSATPAGCPPDAEGPPDSPALRAASLPSTAVDNGSVPPQPLHSSPLPAPVQYVRQILWPENPSCWKAPASTQPPDHARSSVHSQVCECGIRSQAP